MNYIATTHEIEVTVRPIFERRQSVPYAPIYTWSYEVCISNHSQKVVQLLYRYWKVIDSAGAVKEVRGAGVVGQHPIINPGESFTYSSFTQIPTPTGSMEGKYEMLSVDGGRFEVEIPRFVLAPPVRLVSAERTPNREKPSPTLH